MNHAAALAIKSGRISEWAESWLVEIAPTLQSQYDTSVDTPVLRQRLELLSSYLPTISYIRAAYRKRIREFRKEFTDKNGPRPEKDVKKWDEALKEALGDTHITYELLGDIREDIFRRISSTQTELNSIGKENNTYG